MKRLAACALAAASALAGRGQARAAFGSEQAGTSAGEFLKLGSDARGMGLGGAMAAAAEEASALYWNPAGLSQVQERQLHMSGAPVFQDVVHGFIAYAHPVRPLVPARRRELRPSGRGTIAAGVLYLNAGRVQERSNDCRVNPGCAGGSYTPRDLALLAGWGASLTESLDLGVAIKLIDSRIHAVARTGSADVGARWRTYALGWPYTLALNGRNLAGKLTFREQSDPLPASIRLGQTLRPLPFWLLAADLVWSRDNDFHQELGSEVRLPVGYEGLGVALRGGWSGRTEPGELDGFNGLSLGAGASFRQFVFDFAWSPFGVLGDSKRFSLTYKF